MAELSKKALPVSNGFVRTGEILEHLHRAGTPMGERVLRRRIAELKSKGLIETGEVYFYNLSERLTSTVGFRLKKEDVK